MATEKTTVEHMGVTREVTRDTETGQSHRDSKSAGGSVDLGKRSSLDTAITEAKEDIERNPLREHGETHNRGRK